MSKNLDQLTARLEKAFGDGLVSAVLYGSGAAAGAFDRYSDLNILCVLRAVGPAELAAAEPIFRWWRDLGHPAPLLLTEEEVRASTDCFPIEFHDMREQRRVLSGADIVPALAIGDVFYRAQVEYQLRSAFIRLRQKAAGVLANRRLLVALLAESVSTFLVLGRHVLVLRGLDPPRGKRETIAALGAALGLATAPFEALMDLRENRQASLAATPRELLSQYLVSLQGLIDAVDQLENR